MNKEKILRQCNEIERAVNELYVKRKDNITGDERISLINMLGVIVEEITALPKSNADHIRQMTDEELAEFLRNFDMCIVCQVKCTKEYPCNKGIMEWLKKEVKTDDERR